MSTVNTDHENLRLLNSENRNLQNVDDHTLRILLYLSRELMPICD